VKIRLFSASPWANVGFFALFLFFPRARSSFLFHRRSARETRETAARGIYQPSVKTMNTQNMSLDEAMGISGPKVTKVGKKKTMSSNKTTQKRTKPRTNGKKKRLETNGSAAKKKRAPPGPAVKKLEYELVQSYQTRSIPRSIVLTEAPLTPASYFPNGNVAKAITFASLKAQGVTPRLFYLNHVGWVAHPKDKAPRAYYRKTENGKTKDMYALFPKELVKHVLLSKDCYKEVFELHGGDTVFEEMKKFSDHLKKYNSIPYDKMPDCFVEKHNRTMPDGTTKEVDMYRIEARHMQEYVEAMSTGTHEFFPKPPPGETGSKRRGKSSKSASAGKGGSKKSSAGGAKGAKGAKETKGTQGAKRTQKSRRKKPVQAKPVTLTKKLKAAMTKLSKRGRAFSVTMDNQADFCNDIFERQSLGGKDTDASDDAVCRSMMTTMKLGYSIGLKGAGKHTLDLEEVPVLHDSCLTHATEDATLYDLGNELNETSSEGEPPEAANGNAESEGREDVGFDEESETGDIYSDSERSEDFSETAPVDPRRVREELEDLEDLDMEHREGGALRSGRKRKKADTPVTRVTIDSSESEHDSPSPQRSVREEGDSNVVMIPVSDGMKRLMKQRADDAEKRTRKAKTSATKRKRPEPAAPPRTHDTAEASEPSETAEQCSSISAFTYRMQYTAPMYKVRYDTQSDAGLISKGYVNLNAAISREVYIRAFRSLMIETDISESVIKGLFDFDELCEVLENDPNLQDPKDEENFVITSNGIISSFIWDAIDGNEEEKNAVAETILYEIILPLYWIISRPEKDGIQSVCEGEEHEEEESQEVNPHAVISPFLAAVNKGKKKAPARKSKKSGKKKRRVENSYAYFIGNKQSPLARCLDATFRYMYGDKSDENDRKNFFGKVNASSAKIDAYSHHIDKDGSDHGQDLELSARESICSMFIPDSPLPSWGQYYGTVVCFMEHLFPVEHVGKGFLVEKRIADVADTDQPSDIVFSV
jgi:hypothetical protein